MKYNMKHNMEKTARILRDPSSLNFRDCKHPCKQELDQKQNITCTQGPPSQLLPTPHPCGTIILTSWFTCFVLYEWNHMYVCFVTAFFHLCCRVMKLAPVAARTCGLLVFIAV